MPHLPGPLASRARVFFGREASCRHIELLAGSPQANVDFRVFHDSGKASYPARNFHGNLNDHFSRFSAAQAAGAGIFLVINVGGHRDEDVAEIRAVFIDSDGRDLGDVTWLLMPDFIVHRDETHWHAYWLVADVPVNRFRNVQRRLAQFYGTDIAVNNPSRVMRLAGFNHLKNPASPCAISLIDLTSEREGGRRILSEVLDGLPEEPSAENIRTPCPLNAAPLTLGQFREWLSYIDPTFKDDQATWAGMALAIRYGELPVVSYENIDWEEILVEWCSGKLWRDRTGDTSFEPITYKGREELMIRVRKSRGPYNG